MPQNLLQGLAGAAPPLDLRQMGALELAFLGDTLHDLYVRDFLVRRGAQVNRLHKRATALVNAGAQARMLRGLWPTLSEEEIDVARRGRNAQARHAVPKGATLADYRLATGLEALWGYLYLSGRIGRLLELLGQGISLLENPNESPGPLADNL